MLLRPGADVDATVSRGWRACIRLLSESEKEPEEYDYEQNHPYYQAADVDVAFSSLDVSEELYEGYCGL